MNSWGGYPVYQNTSVTYFPLGDDQFPELKRQLAVVNGKLDNLQTQNEALRAELARLKQEK